MLLLLKVITFISCLFANPKDGAASCGSEVIVYIDLYIECTKQAIMGGTW